MNKQMLAMIILLPFGILSVYALWEVGYIGLFEYQLQHAAGWQVLADLVVALVLVLSWMAPELKKVGRSVLPWVVLTLLLGSFGPLLYLAFFRSRVTSAQPANAS